MIEDDRGSIDYAESGSGPAVVFVPGSCSTGAAWRPILSRLGNGVRAVTTSLLGYGGTAERRTLRDADISREAEILEAVIRRTAAPVHLVGHSFGGAAAIAVAFRRRVPLLSLVIIEAPVPELLRHAGEDRHYRAFRKMTEVYFDAFRAGETAAIEGMIDFYGGAGTFAAWPERVRRYAVDTTPVNILDWASAYDFQLTPGCLANIDLPALVLRGGASHPAMRCASALLARYLANASLATIAGAAHFMISTHAEEVADVIGRHLAGVERGDKQSGPALALHH